MRSVRRNLGTVLIVAAAVSIPTALDVRAAAPGSTAQAAQGSMSDRAKFVGTYRLITTEVKDASGKWSRTPNFSSIGYITYADTGHMGVHIMPRNRPRFASTLPTGEEAQAALRGYTAYFGSFTVDDKSRFVVHHRVGQINPGGVVDAKRFYDFDGDVCALNEPAVRQPLIKSVDQLLTSRNAKADNPRDGLPRRWRKSTGSLYSGANSIVRPSA